MAHQATVLISGLQEYNRSQREGQQGFGTLLRVGGSAAVDLAFTVASAPTAIADSLLNTGVAQTMKNSFRVPIAYFSCQQTADRMERDMANGKYGYLPQGLTKLGAALADTRAGEYVTDRLRDAIHTGKQVTRKIASTAKSLYHRVAAQAGGRIAGPPGFRWVTNRSESFGSSRICERGVVAVSAGPTQGAGPTFFDELPAHSPF
ncbi:hypothetical protein [Sulfidibacter corallicola]|uniref:Uncharacterized protein n=1 Tax=Sulfidibacter corallicola TaxID=2818388 RepID=A0A8A4TXN7_SULCO|nr:hypothetical protein [Sulfidibacter corallicola]QTD54260.1 hypothetical protein J3U87_17585 [Sulfidibacter corallicola]